MKGWSTVLTLSAALAGGCAIQTNDSMHTGVTPANCVASSGTPECAMGVRALTKQSVASDRCVESFLFRDDRRGILQREVLC